MKYLIQRVLSVLVICLTAVPALASDVERKLSIMLGTAAFVGVDRLAEYLGRQAGLDTIADLRAVRIDALMLQFPEDVRISGYYEANDHGGVDYRFDPDCEAADTAGIVLEPLYGPGCWVIIAPLNNRYDARWFGVVADNATDNATALARISTAAVEVEFPIGISLTSVTWYIARGFSGQGKDDVTTLGSSIKATATWLGGDYLIDVRDLNDRNQDFRDINLNGNAKMKYVFGASDLDHSEGGNSGFHRWDRVAFFGATEYLFYFPDTVGSSSMETVGGVCNQCFFNGNHNAGMIYLGTASDDMTFINTRLEHFNGPGFFPVVIRSHDVSFINTFYFVGGDMDEGIDALFILGSGGHSRAFENLFVEPSSSTFTNMKYIFRGSGAINATINGVKLEGGGPTFPSGSALVRLDLGWSAGLLEVRNVYNGLTGFDYVFGIDSDATQDSGDTARQDISFSGLSGFDALQATTERTTTTSGYPRAHFTGTYGGIRYNSLWTHDGTNEHMTHQEPTIITADLDLIAANSDVARLVCPFDATIQRVETVIDGALATGNATVTMAVGGVGVTGGVVTITQSGSAADDVAFAVPSAANDCDAREVITGTVGGTSTTGAGTLLVHFAPRAA